MKIPAALTALGLAITPAAADTTEEPLALDVLAQIDIIEDHPMDGYDRDAFAPSGWQDANGSGCTTREDILARDLEDTQLDGCTVEYGHTIGAYSGEPIEHIHGESQVDIEHVVAVGQAWRNGAHAWDEDTLQTFYQDEENLIAAGSAENSAKSDYDVTDYMPPNQGAYCTFTAATVYIKDKYDLAMNPDEHALITDVLEDPECDGTPAAPAQAIYTDDWETTPTADQNTTDTSLASIVNDTNPLLLAGIITVAILALAVLAFSPRARRMLTRSIKRTARRNARRGVRSAFRS